MIRKSMPSGEDPTGEYRFSLATNAERVCAEIMLKQYTTPGAMLPGFGRFRQFPKAASRALRDGPIEANGTASERGAARLAH
jgi:hypothetical protein